MKTFSSLLQNFGFNIWQLKNLKNLRRFQCEKKEFLKRGGKITGYFPFLNDYNSSAGIASGHYFHQDLLIAKYIYKRRPIRHIDIGSRIDGFIAHVAAFRKVEVFDIRKLKIKNQENILFKKMDIMKEVIKNRCDSISCLHAIEHFGLGRYGDKIDPNGHLKGYQNICKVLKPNGHLYISFPISDIPKIEFNAHRIFSATEIFSWPTGGAKMKLIRFDFVDDKGNLHLNKSPKKIKNEFNWSCGIYTFQKIY